MRFLVTSFTQLKVAREFPITETRSSSICYRKLRWVPVIVGPNRPHGEPIRLFEAGAILIYLAKKIGQFIPKELGQMYEVIQWLTFQVDGFGSMLGQAHLFLMSAPERIQYAIDRYANEATRLYSVLDQVLSILEYRSGDAVKRAVGKHECQVAFSCGVNSPFG